MADTGANTHVTYLWEDNGYKASPNDSTYKTFGANARLTVAEGANNAVQVVQPGADTPNDTIEQMFEGAWGVQFELTNAYWLRFLLGSPSTTGSGPYTHTYSSTLSATSARVVEGYENSDKHRNLLGCLASQVQIQPAVNQNVRVTIRGPYAKESITDESGGGIQSQVATSYRTMTFAQASLSVDSTTKSLAQDASLSLPLNAQLIPVLGSRFATDFWHPVLRPRLDFTTLKNDGDTVELEDMYGGSTTMQDKVTDTDPATLTFDNGESSTDINKLTINLTGTFPESYGEDGSGDPDALIRERVNRAIEGVNATYENNTATAP